MPAPLPATRTHDLTHGSFDRFRSDRPPVPDLE